MYIFWYIYKYDSLYSGNFSRWIFSADSCDFFQHWWLIMSTFCIATLLSIYCPGKGCQKPPKRMNFWKSSKRSLIPSPLFMASYIADFATKLWQKCVCSLLRDCCVLYDPISHDMRVVQQLNIVIGWKHTLKRPFCSISCWKSPNLAI